MQKTVFSGCDASLRRRHCLTKTLLVMKLTIVLLTAGFLNVAARGVSQTITFSGKNVSLERVFREIKKQTGYLVFYEENPVERSYAVSVTAKNTPLPEFLGEVLAGKPFHFSIKSKNIITVVRTGNPKIPADTRATKHNTTETKRKSIFIRNYPNIY